MSVYLDANIFGYANYGTAEKGELATKILEKIASGKEHGVTSCLTLDEVMWICIKQKKTSEMRQVISDIYRIPNLTILEAPSRIAILAVDFVEEYNLKPRDAVHCAVMRENGIETIYSEDHDFDRVKWIKRKFL